jgi:hypothetical protein
MDIQKDFANVFGHAKPTSTYAIGYACDSGKQNWN